MFPWLPNEPDLYRYKESEDACNDRLWQHEVATIHIVHACANTHTHTHTHTHTKAKAKFLAALTRSRYLANPGCLFTKQVQ